MKHLILLMMILNGLAVEAQLTNKDMSRFISLYRSDQPAFLLAVDSVDSQLLPGEFLYRYGQLHLKQDLNKARLALEEVKRRGEDYIRIPEKVEGYLSTAHLQVNVARVLREVYLQLGEYELAIPLLEKETVTYDDIHADGSCATPWIESQTRVDYARCYLGLKDTSKAMDQLFWDKCFYLECFDSKRHFEVLSAIKGSTEAKRGVIEAFENPIFLSIEVESPPNNYIYFQVSLVFFGDTIKTPHSIDGYSTIEKVPAELLKQARADSKKSYYYDRVIKQ